MRNDGKDSGDNLTGNDGTTQPEQGGPSPDPVSLDIDPAVLKCLPIFPLPGGVLFPGATVPLHLFEPRYRALAEYCVSGPRAMAIAFIEAGNEAAYYGRPPVRAVMGAGALVAQRRLADGRWNIALRGLGRVRLLREHPAAEDPFRLGRVEPVPCIGGDAPQTVALARTVRTLLLEVAQLVPAGMQQLDTLLNSATSAGALADLAAHAFATDTERRQVLLETPDVAARLELLVDTLGLLLLELSQAVRV